MTNKNEIGLNVWDNIWCSCVTEWTIYSWVLFKTCHLSEFGPGSQIRVVVKGVLPEFHIGKYLHLVTQPPIVTSWAAKERMLNKSISHRIFYFIFLCEIDQISIQLIYNDSLAQKRENRFWQEGTYEEIYIELKLGRIFLKWHFS